MVVGPYILKSLLCTLGLVLKMVETRLSKDWGKGESIDFEPPPTLPN